MSANRLLPPIWNGRLRDLPPVLVRLAAQVPGRVHWYALPHKAKDDPRRGLYIGLSVDAAGGRAWVLSRFGAPVSDVEIKTCRQHFGLAAETWAATERPHQEVGFPRCVVLTPTRGLVAQLDAEYPTLDVR